MKPLAIDSDYLWGTLLGLLEIPSPSGYTDQVVRHTVGLLAELGLDTELTRRGAIRAVLPGRAPSPGRALVAHVDTLGAMVRGLKESGRLALAPVGTWSARFAEGARVSIFSRSGVSRGTILPLKASGHVYDAEVDRQPIGWDYVELRVDERVSSRADLEARGIAVGDFVGIDPAPEITETGFICSRHLDDKGGVAALLAATKAIIESKADIPIECHLLFTISEEVGSGASAVLRGDVSELVSIDNATPAPGQESTEYGVTLAFMDSSGPFDYHLTRRLVELCERGGIPFARDVFRYYRCDAASAIEAGNDLRTALICFGADASHGYERVHIDSLISVARLVCDYVQSPPTVARDEKELGSIEGFPRQPSAPYPVHPTIPEALPGGEEHR